MRIEDFLNEVKDYLIRRDLVWLSVEEARAWGMNLVYYTLSVEPTFMMGLLACEVNPFEEDILPIAMMVVMNPETSKDIKLDKLTKVLNSVGGYLFKYGEDDGVIIPVDEHSIKRSIDSIAYLVRELFGKNLRPFIDGYFLDTFE